MKNSFLSLSLVAAIVALFPAHAQAYLEGQDQRDFCKKMNDDPEFGVAQQRLRASYLSQSQAAQRALNADSSCTGWNDSSIVGTLPLRCTILYNKMKLLGHEIYLRDCNHLARQPRAE